MSAFKQRESSSSSAVTIGVDYGTESGRVVVLSLDDGQELASVAVAYRHRVIDRMLPGSQVPLPADWALEHPSDYLDVLRLGVPQALAKAAVAPDRVVGLGVDATSCTVIPVDASGTPLCLDPAWAHRPHAWPKLWKHHAAQPWADRLTEVAEDRGESFLSRYGGRISAEWYFPKLLEIFSEDRAVYDAMAGFVEATDWIVWHLTGLQRRNSCTAGYKAFWAPEEGLPNLAYFEAVQEGFRPEEKLGTEFYPLGTKAGTIRPEVAQPLGLSREVAVAVGNVDAMVSVPAVGVNAPGTLVMVMGTSICHLTITREEVRLPGVTGVVKDGILPGWYGYEAGQAAVGDMFGWFVERCLPPEYHRQAKERKQTLFEYLEDLASQVPPGSRGLVALDWWNGNRSILGDADLSGVLVGLHLATRPEEMYRALLESTAMGTKRIVENFEQHGIGIQNLLACGGLAQKSPLLMQIYADVANLPVQVTDSDQVPARGSALFGALAAGSNQGGFDSMAEASERLAAPIRHRYQPDPQRHQAYLSVYGVYRDLYARMGQDVDQICHRLTAIRRAERPTDVTAI